MFSSITTAFQLWTFHSLASQSPQFSITFSSIFRENRRKQLRVSGAGPQSTSVPSEASKTSSVPSQMKPWVYKENGGMNVLKFDTEVAVPEVKVVAAAINPVDAKRMAEKFKATDFPLPLAKHVFGAATASSGKLGFTKSLGADFSSDYTKDSVEDLPEKYDVDKLRSMSGTILSTTQEAPSTRRGLVVCTGVSLLAILTLNCSLTPLPVWAKDNSNEEEENDGVIGSIKSLFDPNEKTKSGKVLPKAYLKSARELVKTLRESLEEDPKDNAKFRRTADAAKGSIRDYLSNWRGQQKVASEESYTALEKAIRSLAGFYSKAGPSGRMPEEVKSEILNDLSKAEEFL